MTKKRKTGKQWRKSKKMAAFEQRPLSQRVVRGLIPFVLAVLVVYGAVLLLSRTEGCRALVAEQLEEQLDMPVAIEKLRVHWNLSVEARDVHTEPRPDAGVPGFAAERVRIWGPWYRGLFAGRPGIERLDVSGLKLSLALDENGGWKPEPFGALAAGLQRWGRFDLGTPPPRQSGQGAKRRKTVSEKKKAKPRRGESDASDWSDLAVRVNDGEITWWDQEGHLLGVASGLELDFTPLDVPRRGLLHYRVAIDNAATASGEDVEDLLIELLSTEGHHIVLAFRADWKARSPTSGLMSGSRQEPEEVTKQAPQVKESATVKEESPNVVRRDAEELADYFRGMLESALVEEEGGETP